MRRRLDHSTYIKLILNQSSSSWIIAVACFSTRARKKVLVVGSRAFGSHSILLVHAGWLWLDVKLFLAEPLLFRAHGHVAAQCVHRPTNQPTFELLTERHSWQIPISLQLQHASSSSLLSFLLSPTRSTHCELRTADYVSLISVSSAFQSICLPAPLSQTHEMKCMSSSDVPAAERKSEPHQP